VIVSVSVQVRNPKKIPKNKEKNKPEPMGGNPKGSMY
jgi:hypothetical protein